MEVGGQRHIPAALSPDMTQYPLYRRLGDLQGRSVLNGKSRPPTGNRSPDRPSRSESLYWLRYTGPRDKKNNSAAEDTASVAGMLSLYALVMTQRWKTLLPENLFSYWGCRSVFWFIVLSGWVNSSRCFEGTYILNLQGCDFVKAVHFFKTRGKNYPITQRKNTEDLLLNNYAGETCNYCFCIVMYIFLFILSYTFIIGFCWCKIALLSSKETIELSQYVDENLHKNLTILPGTSKGKRQYCSELYVGIQNSKDMMFSQHD